MEVELKNTMSLNPEDRNHNQVQEVVEKLNHIEFFKNLMESHGREAVREWCTHLRLKQFKPDDNIITYRDVGEEYFIIIEGQAKIYVPVEFTFEGTKDDVIRYKETHDVLLIPSSDPNIENWNYYETINYNEESGAGNFKIRLLKSLNKPAKKGSSFGELSLITNKPRAATVKASTDTFCAVLSRKDYE